MIGQWFYKPDSTGFALWQTIESGPYYVGRVRTEARANYICEKLNCGADRQFDPADYGSRHAPSALPDRVASRYQEGFTAGYRKAQEDLGVETGDRAASYKVTEIENYRLALAWISKQSNDPHSRELASQALEAFEAAADTSAHGNTP